jgi:hypothetical protein
MLQPARGNVKGTTCRQRPSRLSKDSTLLSAFVPSPPPVRVDMRNMQNQTWMAKRGQYEGLPSVAPAFIATVRIHACCGEWDRYMHICACPFPCVQCQDQQRRHVLQEHTRRAWRGPNASQPSHPIAVSHKSMNKMRSLSIKNSCENRRKVLRECQLSVRTEENEAHSARKGAATKVSMYPVTSEGQ